MPELSTAPADAAVARTDKLLTLTFENVSIGDALALAEASDASYDNSTSGLSATDVQAAIDELAAGGGGGASIGVQYDADLGSTADSDPGAGLLKWNNATQTSATFLYLDDSTSDGASLTGWWSALDAGGFIYLQHATDQDTWQIWEITAVTDASGYVKLAVSLLANGDAFADGDSMLVTMQQGPGSPPTNRSTVSALATSGSVAVDYALGDYFTVALAGNVSGFTFSNLPGSGHGATLMIRFTQDSTPRTVAWPASFKWAGGVAGVVSTASGAVDVLAITTFDNGTTWDATLAKAFA